MKKYFFAARKTQLEKPTEPKQYLAATARVIVFANDEEEAKTLAEAQLRKDYYGTGILLGEAKLTKVCDLPVDWNYGYCDGRKLGTAEDRAALKSECTKK